MAEPASATQQAADSNSLPLPVHDGPGVATCCWVYPGDWHTPSCEHVTPEHLDALLAHQGRK